ncbi:hypothetical protein [Micromonospora lupini]|uniref:PIN domain-containing protein n=1 Tax=Micromonospora lupini str. Lupac 08 TaxID=1150864 RepID=I0L7X8_9ACTN|nr:hypothetical protein [Micromonospora lupini]CCH19925.1 Protein of unknown function [Micromonospora lupini str. Lupac 08]
MTAEPQPPVRLILDRSALLGYAVLRTVHVGEPVHEVIEDGVRFGVPVVAAAEALNLATGKDLALLHRLLALPSCALLPERAQDLPELTFWQRRTRRFDLAAAAVAGLTHDAAVLTGEGPGYSDGIPLIHFPG